MDLKLKVAGILDDSLKSGSLGVVIIGRDEGQRLRRCLESLSGDVPNVVYVDSGSTDQSVAVAQSFGADVVMLDDSLPFSAARARNAGFKRLLTVAPEVEHVQFLDGDCAVLAGWFEAAGERGPWEPGSNDGWHPRPARAWRRPRSRFSS